MYRGEGTITAQFGALDGAEAAEIFEHFLDAEFRTDWDTAQQTFGEHTTKAVLARTDAQRRADALMTILRTAANAPTNTAIRAPTVNLVIDATTFADHLVELEMLPERFTADWAALRLTQRRCETTSGIPITPHDAFQAAIAGHLRCLIVNRRGLIIQASATQRLFRGAARQVVMTQHPHCTHPGCRIRTSRSHADHTHPHRTHQRQHRVPPPQHRPLPAPIHHPSRRPRLAHLPSRRDRNRLPTTATAAPTARLTFATPARPCVATRVDAAASVRLLRQPRDRQGALR